MLPESKLIKNELIIRELVLPEEVKMARKSLLRWVALTLGLLLPNESRRLMLDVLEALIQYHVLNQQPTTKDIIEKIKQLSGEDPYPKAVYYHLLKLKEIGLISRTKGQYTLGDGSGKKLNEVFKEFYTGKIQDISKNLDEAAVRLQESYHV